MCDCNDTERAKTGRVHKEIQVNISLPHTGVDRPALRIIGTGNIDNAVICEGGTGKIEQVTLMEYTSTAGALTKKAQRIIITNRDISLVSGGDFTFGAIFNNYESLIADIKVASADWDDIDGANELAYVQLRNLNINFKAQSEAYNLYVYLVADELQTIEANTGYIIKFSITKD